MAGPPMVLALHNGNGGETPISFWQFQGATKCISAVSVNHPGSI